MPSTAPAAAAAAAPAAVAAASAATASTASTALAASPPPKIEVKVSWLKQKPVAGNRQPVLEFDEQQLHAFPPETTTFRQVKHECSYPAPPHKVRMWCSSFGAAADLPTTMELNVFINTFELITEEKHTLSMAHLTGGETIAFEMVQGEHVSELSGFLLGDHVGRAKKGQGGAASGQAQLVLPGGVNAPAGILQPLAQARAASELKQKVDAAAQLSNQLAAELIAEEEEEKAKREKKKAKKKGKKDKQREKKKALAGEPPAAKAAGGSEEEEEDNSEEEQPAASSSSASAPAASGAGGSSAGGSRSGGSGSAGGASSSAAAQGGRAVGAGSPSGGEAGAGGGAVESEADYEGLSEEQLRAQVLKSHQLIRALVEQCLLERRSKEALAVQMADYEAAAAAQHSEYAADVAHLRAQLAKARAQSIN